MPRRNDDDDRLDDHTADDAAAQDDQSTDTGADVEDGATDDAEAAGSTLDVVEAALERTRESHERAEGESSDDDDTEPGEDGAAAEGDEASADAPQSDEEVAGLSAQDLTPPEGTSERARERFQKLTDTLREREQLYQQTSQELNELRTMVTETGAAPEEIGAGLQYMQWIHSDNPEDLKQALAFIERERRGLAAKLNQPIDGLELHKEHDDLVAAVENLDMTPEYAEEMARLRARTELERQRAERTSEVTTERQLVEHTAAALNQLDAELRRADLDYARKLPLLERRLPQLIELYGRNPQRLVAEVRNTWEEIGMMASLLAPEPKRSRQAQPINSGARAGNPPRGAPATTLDAIEMSIGKGVDG